MSTRAHRRSAPPEEHASSERWLLTYADMITLLLALFVVLFALSSINVRKFLAFREGLTQTFNPSAVQTQGGSGLLQQTSVVNQPGTNPSPTPVLAGTSAPTPEQVAKSIENAFVKAGLSSDASVTITNQGVVVQILADKVFFSSDSANFAPAGDSIVDTLARVVAKDPNGLEVEGYTDDTPVTGGPYQSNWELSAARAANVANRMNVIDHINQNRLSAVGFGDTHPQASNTSAPNKALNRRVDVVVLNS